MPVLTALSWLGRFSWPVLGSLLPGMSPRLMMVLAGLLAALVVIGGPAGAVWLVQQGKQREAVNLAEARCELRITESAAASARALAGILANIKDEDGDIGKTSKELCAGSPFCRDRGKK